MSNIKGYSIVSLRDDEGNYTVGFRKIKSALNNWEDCCRQVEEMADKALLCALEDIGEVTWWDKVFREVNTPKEKICSKAKYVEIKDALVSLGYLTKQEGSLLSNSLKYVRFIDHYKALSKMVKNGEQFFLSDQLCGFINDYSTYSPKGDRS